MSSFQDRSPDLALVVDTPNGRFIRQVRRASDLEPGLDRGSAAEQATRSAVARWGVPDFIFRPVVRRKGSTGVRELGDALVLVGHYAVVVQVKSRHAPSDEEARETAWITKNVTQALRQARGTIRAMRSASHDMVNLRGRTVEVDGRRREWLSVVVIDHPAIPSGISQRDLLTNSSEVILSRRDWEFVFNQLRSVHAVVQYLHRVMHEEAIELGEEPVRYYSLAQADSEAPPSGTDIPFAPGGRRGSSPLLPLAPAGHGEIQAHMLLRALMEDVALSPLPEGITEENRLQALAAIDELPVGHRADLGRAILDMMNDVVGESENSGVVWRFRRIRRERGAAHLMFGVCSREHSEQINEAFMQWAVLRHYELGADSGGLEDINSAGILLTPRHDGLRPWDTTLVFVSGDPGVTGEELAQMRRLWAVA
jgi:hypothetical protein